MAGAEAHTGCGQTQALQSLEQLGPDGGGLPDALLGDAVLVAELPSFAAAVLEGRDAGARDGALRRRRARECPRKVNWLHPPQTKIKNAGRTQPTATRIRSSAPGRAGIWLWKVISSESGCECSHDPHRSYFATPWVFLSHVPRP